MKTIKCFKLFSAFILFVLLVVSCQNTNQPQPAPTITNFFEITVGTLKYKATTSCGSYCKFDEENSFKLSSKVIDMTLVNPGNSNWMLCKLIINQALNKISNFGFVYGGNPQSGYCCYPQSNLANSQGTDLSINITRNDNVVGGLIEGTITGNVKKIDPPATAGSISNSCSGALLQTNGSFKLIIR